MARHDAKLKHKAATAGDGNHSREREFVSDETALALEQAEADLHDPDWDLTSRIATARGALQSGTPPEIVRKAYGEKVFAAATATGSSPEVGRAEDCIPKGIH